jgi:hypothetical protein
MINLIIAYLKRFFNSTLNFFEEVGRIKAAAHLSRIGNHKAAVALMSKD